MATKTKRTQIREAIAKAFQTTDTDSRVLTATDEIIGKFPMLKDPVMPAAWKILSGEEITEEDLRPEQAAKESANEFERAMGFGTLPWLSNTTWEKFYKFVAAQPLKTWREYATWRTGTGKYTAYSNKQIRENPQAFMDTGVPEFLARNNRAVEPEPAGIVW